METIDLGSQFLSHLTHINLLVNLKEDKNNRYGKELPALATCGYILWDSSLLDLQRLKLNVDIGHFPYVLLE